MVKKKFVRLICNNFYNVSSLYSKAPYPNVANNCTVERKKQLVRFQMFGREMCFVRRLIFPKDNNQRLKHKSCSVDLSRRKHPECYRAGGSAMKVALTQQPARSLFSGYFLNLGGLAFTRRISARNHVQRNVPLNAVIILDTRQPITLVDRVAWKNASTISRFTSTANDDSLATRTTNSLLFAFNCTEGAVRQKKKKRKGATREFSGEEISFSSRFLSSEYYIVSVCFSLMAQKFFTLGSVLVYKRKAKFADNYSSIKIQEFLENVLRLEFICRICCPPACCFISPG